MVRTTQRSRGLMAVVGAVAAVALLAGCSGNAASPATDPVAGSPSASGSSSSSSSSTTTSTPAELTVTPADGSTGVKPDQPVVVKAVSGALGTVSVTDAKGRKVAGTVAGDGTWTSTARLAPSASYTVTAAAKGEDGTPSTTTARFSTLKPKVTATYGILNAGATVGVGMPVAIQFDSAVTTAQQRADIEKRVKVTTNPKQAGAWGWLDSRQLMWRPASYWKPGTTVTVAAPLTGVQTGPDKWVGNDDNASFTVGSAMVSTVDIKAHTMTVRRGGQVIKVIPVSTGRPGKLTETRSGTKVIIRKEGEVTMDSTTIGIAKGKPGYYKIDTKWNLRVTWTGEYLHAAPWSVGAQGNSNVSHGCVNMSLANAQWMFENSKVGDIVKFTGSNRPFLPTEGIGVWQYSYKGWKAQSALV
ncbi:Ig-like domain-containing protein [Phycicoccus sp. Root101]|uniref:L,D-transpeptidase n=1 Tax=Phycicoccus sp. Root101 TaxID=1736421 RepID=UPI001F324415|nr:Ig-like domain-containing protein [Phycicoccus sp. Root101]